MSLSDKTIRGIVYYLSPVVIYGVMMGLIDFIDKQSNILKNLGVWAPILFVAVLWFITIFIALHSKCKYKFDPFITFINPLAFFLVIYVMLLFDEGYKHNAFNAFFDNGFIYLALAIFFISFIFSYHKLRVKNIAERKK